MKEDIKIIKTHTILNRMYYNLILNNEKIGRAWITKKYIFLFNGLYIKLNPKARNKGYGQKYYDLLMKELANNNIEIVTMWVNNNNKIAISFFNKVVYKYADRLKFLNYTGFVETLIEE